MFQIWIDPVQQSCDELNKMLKVLDGCQDKAESAVKALESMHGFEKVISVGRKQTKKLKEERRLLQKESKVLEDILLNYRLCENRMLLNGEESFLKNRMSAEYK